MPLHYSSPESSEYNSRHGTAIPVFIRKAFLYFVLIIPHALPSSNVYLRSCTQSLCFSFH